MDHASLLLHKGRVWFPNCILVWIRICGRSLQWAHRFWSSTGKCINCELEAAIHYRGMLLIPCDRLTEGTLRVYRRYWLG
jgi:hypothetical protein